MTNRPPISFSVPTGSQSDKSAGELLKYSIDQLSATTVGDPQWRQACQLLGQIDPAFAPLQLEALADDRYQVCRALSVALSQLGPSIFYDVIAALDHEHPNVRQFAAGLLYGLAQRGGVVIEDAVLPLADKLKDPDVRVRERAVVTLSIMGPDARAAVPQLVEALSDQEEFVREWAVHALAAIGPAAADAIPALIEALLDDEPCVSQAASEAIITI